MTIVAGIPSNFAASAIAWAWLPEENETTPARRWSGSNWESALKAPRNLNAPTRWKFSHLKNTSAPTRWSAACERNTGVRWACPAMRSDAATMSSKLRAADSAMIGQVCPWEGWGQHCNCPRVERSERLVSLDFRLGPHSGDYQMNYGIPFRPCS